MSQGECKWGTALKAGAFSRPHIASGMQSQSIALFQEIAYNDYIS